MFSLLKRFLPPYRLKALIGVLSKVIEVVFEVLTPLVVAHMIDKGVGAADTSEIVSSGFILLVFAVVSYSFTFVCQRLAAEVSQGLGTDVRNALYRHVNTLSEGQVESFGTPSLITRLTNDVNQVQLAVALTIRLITRWPVLAIGSMIAATLIDFRLGLIFVVCMPLIGFAFALVMRASIPLFSLMQKQLDQISKVVRETLSGMRVIRALRQEETQERLGYAAIERHASTAIRQGRLSATLNPATFLIMNAGISVILLVGAGLVNTGELTTGEIIAFVSYMTQALTAVTVMANLVVVLMRGQTSSLRIMGVLAVEPEIVSGASGEAPSTGVPAIELKEVSFTYPGADVAALDGVTLSVAEGQTLGVIGGTGSGKSTLASLLCRLFDASSGTVSILGTPIEDYRLDAIHNLVSLVPQHTSLVSGTIRSNLLWRDEAADDQELWRALELAQAKDFVERLEGGLGAVVEAAGKNFSGGQRQRLTIARALVGHPRIVILDDAASALDFSTDARLRHGLTSLSGELTSVIISQRVSSVMGADQILVLDHGRVAGLGTHEDLLEGSRIYREIVASQMGEDSHVVKGGASNG